MKNQRLSIQVLVILYNKNPMESETIKSILRSRLKGTHINIVIWNNGEKFFSEDCINEYLTTCQHFGLETKIYQDIRNISLSKIYNFFTNNIDGDYYSILDQDSNVNSDFFENIKTNAQFLVIAPLIYAKKNGKMRVASPMSKKDYASVAQPGMINAASYYYLGSGLSFSKKLVELNRKNKKNCFDENYAFYHVDSSFTNNISSYGEVSGMCIGEMNHDLAERWQTELMSENRKLEVMYEAILRRIYGEKKKGVFSNLFYCLKLRKKWKCSAQSLISALTCVVKKKHPRSQYEISKDISPTHTSNNRC